MALAFAQKSKPSYSGTRTNGSHSFVGSAVRVAWNLVMYPGASSFRGVLAFSRPLARNPAPKDQRRQTVIGRERPETIDAARESVIIR